MRAEVTDDLDQLSPNHLHYHHHHVSSRSNSPPPSAYSAGTSPPPPSTTSSTPLLMATLNAPVATYYSTYNRNKADVGSVVVQSSQNSACGGPNLAASKQHKPDDYSNGLSNVQSSFYSSLVEQLRSKTGSDVQQPAATSVKQPLLTISQHQNTNNNNIKKEKLKSLPFVCQVCNKRFQRHIALNAHFQNEHITSSSGGSGSERSCKLCGVTAPSLTAIRLHLRCTHSIDLDNPVKCLDDAVPGKSVKCLDDAGVSSKPAIRQSSTLQPEETEPSCSNIDMYESSEHSSCSPTASIASISPARTPSSSTGASPDRSLYSSIKVETCMPQQQQHNNVDDDDPQVEDLRIRKSSPVLSRRAGCWPAARSPSPGRRSASPAAKRNKVSEDYSLHHQSTADTGLNLTNSSKGSSSSSTTCTHCNIVYPNQTLYFLHRGFHSDSNPWRCNSCGHVCSDLYDFNTHLFSASHK